MEIQNIKKLEVPKTYNILIYGQPGQGKTTIATKTAKPILIDFDNGSHRAIANANTDVARGIENLEEVTQFINGLKDEYSTIVIDTVGKFVDMIVVNSQKKLGRSQLRIQDWGMVKNEFMNFTRAVNSSGKSIVYLAHELESTIEIDGANKLFKRPDLGSGSGGRNLIRDLDAIGYIRQIDKNRVLDFASSENYYTKDGYSISRLSIPAFSLNETSTFLSETIQAAMQTKFGVNYEALDAWRNKVENLRTELQSVSGAEELNEIFKLALEDKKALLELRAEIMQKSKELDLIFNKQEMLFFKKPEEAQPPIVENPPKEVQEVQDANQ